MFCGIEVDNKTNDKLLNISNCTYQATLFNANFIISTFPAEANWENGSADDSVNCTGKCSICAHSWEPQLLLAGYPPLDIFSPCSLFLCLRFLSWSLPLQIFFNATEECQNVEHLWPVHRISVFFFQLLLGSELWLANLLSQLHPSNNNFHIERSLCETNLRLYSIRCQYKRDG